MDEDDRIDSSHIQELCEECHGLLVLNGGRFQLPHDSVREFLMSAADPKYPGLEGFWRFRAGIQATMGRLCLTYLTFDHFKNIQIASRQQMDRLHEKFPLLRYASHNWGYHFARAQGFSEALDAEAAHFLTVQRYGELAMHVIHADEALWPYSEMRYRRLQLSAFPAKGPWIPAHHLAWFGITGHPLKFALDLPAVKHRDGLDYSATDYAILRGHKTVVDWILDFCLQQAQESGNMQDPKHFQPASSFCLPAILTRNKWPDSLQKLLDLGFGVDERENRYSDSALHQATRVSRFESLRVLPPSITNINVENRFGETPFW